MRTLKPHQKTKRETRRNRRKSIFVSFLLLVIASTFIWVMNHEMFKVTKVELSGNETILDIDIRNTIEESLNKKILWLLPRDNVLLTSTIAIEQKIENLFPKIYDAEAVIKEGDTLSVSVEEREPHSLWCKNENYISDFDEECYFADQRGYIYTRAPYFSGGVFEKIYTTNELLQIGEQVLDRDEFDEFFTFTEYLYNEYGITVDRIFVNDQNETQIYINSFLKNNFAYKPYIIYHNTDTYEVILRNIGLMVGHEFFTKEFEKYPERLEFIDVRITNQIRYKFTPLEDYIKRQNEEQEKEKSDEETTETSE